MELLKENWIRIAYAAVSACIVWVAYRYHAEVLADMDTFNRLSYVGGVATFIGLLITVCEVLHAISISKGIRAEARALLAQARSIDRAALLSECLLMIDRIHGDLIDRRHATALQCLQQIRRTYLRAASAGMEPDELLTELAKAEALLQGSGRTSIGSLESRTRLDEIRAILLKAKTSIEQLITQRREPHVS